MATSQNQQRRELPLPHPERVPRERFSPLTESGHPGIEYGVWAGLIAPKGTPSDLVQRLNAALKAAAAQPALREKREAAGALIQVGSAADMQRRVREATIFWRGVFERAGIKAE